MKTHLSIKAILWDYDGTLVDSRIKNLNVTRKIIEKATGKKYTHFSALRNLQDFEKTHQQSINWRDFYYKQFGFTEQQVDKFGSWWTEFQINDNTPLELFPGIFDLLKSLENYQHAIVSQNSSQNIKNTIHKLGIKHYFSNVIGYEEVQIKHQKPHPEGLIQCIYGLNSVTDGIIVYIGDHETDAELVFNANQYFKNNGLSFKAVSIGAFYIFPTDTTSWQFKPDYEANSTGDVLDIINRFSS